jgi:hypothetical protein
MKLGSAIQRVKTLQIVTVRNLKAIAVNFLLISNNVSAR